MRSGGRRVVCSGPGLDTSTAGWWSRPLHHVASASIPEEGRGEGGESRLLFRRRARGEVVPQSCDGGSGCAGGKSAGYRASGHESGHAGNSTDSELLGSDVDGFEVGRFFYLGLESVAIGREFANKVSTRGFPSGGILGHEPRLKLV